VQYLAIDESAGLMYVTVYNNSDTDPQSRVIVVDINPGGGTFHHVLREVPLSPGALAGGVVVNPLTHKAYVAVRGAEAGVYTLQGSALTAIPGSKGSFLVVVNEAANLVYALGTTRLNAIDGATDSLFKILDLPGILGVGADLRLGVNRVTGRVYVRSNESPLPDNLLVVDGNRASPTFNTLLATIEVGRGGGPLVVDEGLNQVVTPSLVDLRTFIVDGATNTVMRTVMSTQLPSSVALNRRTHQAYVANQTNTVQVIDLAKGKLTATLVTGTELGLGVVNPADHKLYLPVNTSVTDLRTVDKNGNLATVTGLPTHAGRIIFTGINRKTNRVYVQNTSANLAGDAFLPGFVSTISGKNVIANTTTGAQPFSLVVNEATNKIYSVDAGFGGFPAGITVMDGTTGTTVQADMSAFAGKQFTTGVVNEATNKLYFEVYGGAGVLDGLTNTATPLPDSLAPVANIAANKNLNRVYVASRDADVLHILDGASDAEIAALIMGSPEAMAVNETTGRVYVANEAHSAVTVVDGVTNTIMATIPVGTSPAWLAVNELANRVYVYNADDPSVSFINGETNTVEKTLALPSTPVHNRAVSIVADPGVENEGNGQLFILSDTAGTLAALKQAIISGTAGDPPQVRAALLHELRLAQLALDRGDTRTALIVLHLLENEVRLLRGGVFTDAEADRILALIDAVVGSVS
jgi:YVTN family beta-propeller protein